MPTTARNVRVDDELWAEFLRLTADEGTTASAVIVAAIRRYVRRRQS